MDQQGVPLLHRGKFVTWKKKLEMYLLYLDENILLSIEYGVKDEFNDKVKEIILHGISRSNILYMRCCETTKEMLEKILYYGGKWNISQKNEGCCHSHAIEKENANDSTIIAVENQVSLQEEDESTSDSNDDSSIDIEGQQEDINNKDEEKYKIMALEANIKRLTTENEY